VFSKTYSDNRLSLAHAFSAGVWGLYRYPLRTIEDAGLSGTWSVVFFNACPMIARKDKRPQDIRRATRCHYSAEEKI
jgi:hypothetical protein